MRRWPQFRLDGEPRRALPGRRRHPRHPQGRRRAPRPGARQRRDGAARRGGHRDRRRRRRRPAAHDAPATSRPSGWCICAGAWTARLLETQLGIRWPIRLTQEQVTYFATPNLRDFAPDRFPIWIWHGERGVLRLPGLRRGRDQGGAGGLRRAGRSRRARAGSPTRSGSGGWPSSSRRILPGYSGPELYTRCCLYDMPPDRDFVVDLLPGHPRHRGLHRRRARGQVRRRARPHPGRARDRRHDGAPDRGVPRRPARARRSGLRAGLPARRRRRLG